MTVWQRASTEVRKLKREHGGGLPHLTGVPVRGGRQETAVCRARRERALGGNQSCRMRLYLALALGFPASELRQKVLSSKPPAWRVCTCPCLTVAVHHPDPPRQLSASPPEGVSCRLGSFPPISASPAPPQATAHHQHLYAFNEQIN